MPLLSRNFPTRNSPQLAHDMHASDDVDHPQHSTAFGEFRIPGKTPPLSSHLWYSLLFRVSPPDFPL